MALRTWSAVFALGVGALGVSCTTPQGGTDIGNGLVAVQLNLQGFDGRAVPRRLDLTSGHRVDAALIGIENLRIAPGEDCAKDREEREGPEGEGTLVADLAGAGLEEGPLEFEVKGGTFCRLELELHEAEALGGASVVLRGSRKDGVPFEVRSKVKEEVKLRSKGAPFALEDGGASILLAFDLGAWVDALDLDALAPTADGTIRVEDGSSADATDEALRRFEDAVKASVRLVRDRDGDASLDDEDDETLAE